MHIAWIGTRAPLPAHDGGRLAAWLTIDALARAGTRITVITPGASPDVTTDGVTLAPVHQVRPGWGAAARDAAVRQLPLTIARHAMPAVAARLGRLLADDRPDVVHAEQLHASWAAGQARAAGVPVVLRAHNVEHALWQRGAGRSGVTGWLVRLEGRRLRRYEADALSACDAVITLTDEDRAALQALAPAADVRLVPPAFPSAVAAGRPLEGAPATVWLGSTGWSPNDDATAWLLADVWPAIARRNSDAMLHVFGSGARARGGRIRWHDAPAESRTAMAADAVLLLPLRLASGVRMRVLEAWAAGIPVVGTPAALRGLPVEPGRHALVAHTPAEFAAAVAALHADASLRARLVAGGRALLVDRHDPRRVAGALQAVYHEVAARPMRR